MNAAAAAAPRRQRDVERLLREARAQLGIRELPAACLQGGFDLLLRRIECRPGGPALVRRALRRPEIIQLPGLAQIARLAVLERGGIARRRKLAECALDDAVEGANGSDWL